MQRKRKIFSSDKLIDAIFWKKITFMFFVNRLFKVFLNFNPCGESDQLIVKNLKYFDAKLRFALLASLRSAIFSEIQVDN